MCIVQELAKIFYFCSLCVQELAKNSSIPIEALEGVGGWSRRRINHKVSPRKGYLDRLL